MIKKVIVKFNMENDMKIISIGANHAGTSFLRTIKKIAPNNELVAYEKNTDISFLGCGIAL